MTKVIEGAKKGSGRAATEADDTLRSKAYARILDAISEGEIEGLVDGPKSIYLDGTRLQNDDGEYNFEGVSVEFRAGTQGQEHIEGFPAVENEVSIGVEVKKNVPVTRSITNPNLNALRVKVLIPQLSEQDKNTGDLNGGEVAIAIEVQSGGTGPFTRVVEETIRGKTMSRYERAYRIALPGSAPWNVRMVRLTEDSTSTAKLNQTWLSSITEIIDAKLSYPNTALVGLRVDASQFSSIPTRAYHMRLLRVRVPTNYDPLTRAYSGAWDGTFKIAWTNNPAWCFYDLVTSERYGLGQYVPQNLVDKWALYQIGRYCDELVPDGKGGQEPRFTLNCYLQTREDAYKLLNDMAGAFRGMVFWSSGSVMLTQDSPADPTYLFTNANVIEGQFRYQGASAKQRHTVAHVSWSDLTDLGRQKVEYVEDAAGIERYGVVQTEVTAFGCTSQAQAHRVGRWMLASEMTETETVTFSTGLEGVVLRPGQIIRVRDNYRHGKRLGGRVVAAPSSSQLQLDAPVTIEIGKDYRLYVLLPNGTVHSTLISEVVGDQTILQLSTPMPELAQAGATWILSITGAGAEDRDYRVIAVSEDDEGSVYEITALQHNAAKYTSIDTGTKLDSSGNNPYVPGQPVTNPNGVPAPKTPKVTVTPYSSGSTQKFRLSFSWERGSNESSWEVESRHQDANPQLHTGISSALWEVADADQGYWSLGVRAVNAAGQKSVWVRPAAVFVGKRDFENVISYINAVPGFLKIRVVWELAPELADQVRAVQVWGFKVATESEPQLLATVPAPALSWTHDDIPSGVSWNYRLRAVDQYGNFSAFFPTAGIVAQALLDVEQLLNSINDSIVNSDFFIELGDRIASVGGGSYDALQAEVDRIVRDQNRSGELLLRSVVVDEQIQNDANTRYASLLNSMSIVQDGLALEATARTALQARVDTTEATIASESTARADGDAALASQLSVLQATVEDDVTALIASEQIARASADEALATSVTQVTARLDNVDGVSSGVTVEQKFAAYATRMDTQDGVVEELGASYGVKIDNNGYVTGFGLISEPNNGTPYSSFILRADRFAIGSPSVPGSTPATAIVPFSVYTTDTTGANGEPIPKGVYINGNMVASGTITASKIDARGLTIRDASGNVILGAGAPMNWSYLTGQPAGIYNSNISIGSNGALSGAGGGQVSLNGLGAGSLATKNTVDIGTGSSDVRFWNGTAYETMETADFVNKLTKIGSGNISTFMTSAAIGNAYIGNAAVDTLQIAGNAAAVMASSTGSGTVGTIASAALTMPAGSSGILCVAKVSCNISLPEAYSGSMSVTLQRNGVTVDTADMNSGAGTATMTHIETGATGTVTYSVLVTVTPGYNSVSSSATIAMLGAKR